MNCNELKKADNPIFSFYLSVKMKIWKPLSAFFIFSLLSGCATVPLPQVETINIDRFPPFEMPDGSKIYPESIDESVPDIDILAINADIKTLIDEKVKRIKNSQKRLEKLTKLLVTKVKYDTVDDSYGVKTAQETFDTGSGNCLSFSNLFVAMARYAGFKSRYTEIPTLPNWTRDGEILFFTRHIGASVDIMDTAVQILQLEISGHEKRISSLGSLERYFFSPSEFISPNHIISTYDYTSIPDFRAFAQYYNNVGSKYMAEGKNAEAFRYFVKAIKTDPKLSFAWSNLGVIYRQNSQLKTAEAAYLQGLAVIRNTKDITTQSIMNNLANLYDVTGETEKADFYKTRVASFRKKNPYYQYAAGRTAYYDLQFNKSVGLFKEAIRLKNDEHLFYYGLALAYLKTGEIKKAERNMNRAISHSYDDRRKAYYQQVRDTMNLPTASDGVSSGIAP